MIFKIEKNILRCLYLIAQLLLTGMHWQAPSSAETEAFASPRAVKAAVTAVKALTTKNARIFGVEAKR